MQRRPDIEDWEVWTPVAPSAIAHSEKWPVPRALERHEVKDLVQAWGQGARRAHAAGFDQVIVKNALQDRAREVVEQLTASVE